MFATILILVALGIFTIALEFFLPGGILGVLGIIVLAVAIVLSFTEYGLGTGLIFTTCIVIASIGALLLWLKYFPKLPGGRDLMLNQSVDDGDGQHAKFRDFLHHSGTAITDLRPAGKANINGERLDVVAESALIEAGTPVKVVAVEGYRIVVIPDEPKSSPASA